MRPPWKGRIPLAGAALLLVFIGLCLYALFWVATAIASGDLPWVMGP